jgi:hypothetical protein
MFFIKDFCKKDITSRGTKLKVSKIRLISIRKSKFKQIKREIQLQRYTTRDL